MQIDSRQIPSDGLTLCEEFSPAALDLETECIKYSGPVRARAEAGKIANAVTVKLRLEAAINYTCCRCLTDMPFALRKEFTLNYAVSGAQTKIDLNPDIRDEIILDYPLKPLCRPDCKGLCAKCGKNLNQGKCNCVMFNV
jgi:uncharacterized protein